MSKIETGITGAEFKSFWNDDSVWEMNGSSGFFCEDLVLVVQGQEDLDMDALYGRYGDNLENIPDDAVLTMECGWRLPNSGANMSQALEEDLRVIFREWKKNRNEVSFVASVDVSKSDTKTIERVGEIMAELATLGATVKRSDEPTGKPKALGPKP